MAEGFDDSGFEDMMETAGLIRSGQQQQQDNFIVRFFIKPQRNEKKSKDAGRHIFEDVEMVDIRIPGDRDNLVRPASPEDKARFSKQYEAFRKGQDQTAVEGMPMSEWSQITASMREELAYFGIRTVEQLASTPDSMLQRIGPLLSLRQKARDWLANAKGDAVLVKLRETNDQLASRVAALEKMLEMASAELHRDTPVAQVTAPPVNMAEIVAAVAAAMKAAEPAPKRRGRPPKNGVPKSEG